MRTDITLTALLALVCALASAGGVQAQTPDGRARAFIAAQSARQAPEGGRQVVAQWGGAPRPAAREPARAFNPPRDFFSLLFGIRPDGPPAPSREPRQRIIITPGPSSGGSGDAAGSRGRGSGVAYCVRTCDGRFFPLTIRARAGDPDAQAQCRAFCPAASTEVYTSSDPSRGIEAAYSRDGKAYSALPNAFVFRQRLVDGCSCTHGTRVGGLQSVAIKEDITLKPGDVVMTEEGPRVFAGSRKGPPFRAEDFVTADRFPKLPKDMRLRIRELTVASR